MKDHADTPTMHSERRAEGFEPIAAVVARLVEQCPNEIRKRLENQAGGDINEASREGVGTTRPALTETPVMEANMAGRASKAESRLFAIDTWEGQ